MAKCVCGEEKFVLTHKYAEALLQAGETFVMYCSNCGGEIRGRLVANYRFEKENGELFDPAIAI
jgi:hypothetical protein